MGDKVKDSRLKGKTGINIDNLYLDPNNYRFVDDSNYENINEDKLIDEKVQRRTRNFIEGARRERIKDLIDSFKSNGYLKVDVIQLRDLGDNHFLVIEGNRRVTALKCLQEDFKNGLSIGKLDPHIFSNVPSEINDEKDGLNHLIIMGLKHISGNKKWAAINQAQLIYDYLTKYWEDKKEYQAKEMELCNSLGISKSKLRNSQRAYHLIISYKESDYGDQFVSNMYSIFEEIMKRPVFRNWLAWDDETYISQNRVNEQRLFSWISINDAVGGDEEDGEDDHLSGPIITKALEVRDLAGFITNEKMLVSMEKWHSVARAMLENGTDSRLSVDKSINAVVENIQTIRRYVDVLEEEDLAQLEVAEKELGGMIPRRMISELSSNGVNVCFSVGKIKHYSKIQVESFKKISGLQIDDLRRINIFAGPNNSGKTTILEAVYLLCHQNDISALLDLAKSRNRNMGITPQYLHSLLERGFSIKGEFNDCPVSAVIVRYQDYQVEKHDDYMTSIQADGVIEDKSARMKLHLYGKNPPEREYESIQHICKTIYSSPYYYRPEELYQLYAKAIEAKSNGKMIFGQVLKFIRRVDSSIKNIFLVEENGVKSFRVDSDRFIDKNMELSSYGEGLVRIFELGLAMSNCKNGILLIDEFETAIHYSLLVEFTRFIQELADEFNVQVFITTHSKECIDAFVKNKYRNNDISAYLVDSAEEKVNIKNITGSDLEFLVDSISFDLRGGW